MHLSKVFLTAWIRKLKHTILQRGYTRCHARFSKYVTCRFSHHPTPTPTPLYYERGFRFARRCLSHLYTNLSRPVSEGIRCFNKLVYPLVVNLLGDGLTREDQRARSRVSVVRHVLASDLARSSVGLQVAHREHGNIGSLTNENKHTSMTSTCCRRVCTWAHAV